MATSGGCVNRWMNDANDWSTLHALLMSYNMPDVIQYLCVSSEGARRQCGGHWRQNLTVKCFMMLPLMEMDAVKFALSPTGGRGRNVKFDWKSLFSAIIVIYIYAWSDRTHFVSWICFFWLKSCLNQKNYLPMFSSSPPPPHPGNNFVIVSLRKNVHP